MLGEGPLTVWLGHYRCGCTEEAARKKDLVGYCGVHGDGLLEPLIRLPDSRDRSEIEGREEKP